MQLDNANQGCEVHVTGITGEGNIEYLNKSTTANVRH